MKVEYVLAYRDPRRNQPLVAFATRLHIDHQSSEAFGQAKSAYLVGTAMKALSWHFLPWASWYLEEYWAAIDSPFQEVRLALRNLATDWGLLEHAPQVRGAVSDNLRHLSELRLHPSFPSTEAFLEHCRKQSKSGVLLLDVDEEYRRRIATLRTSLKHWRDIRQPITTGAQSYDMAALTVLTWIWSAAMDHRVTTVFPFVLGLLPELFSMQEVSVTVLAFA